MSSSAGKCSSRTKKTCAQHFAAGSRVVVTATPVALARFDGWGGACSGAKTTCTVVLTGAKTLAASFFEPLLPPKARVLTSVRPPQVERAGGRFRVSLRFRTTRAGTARVRAMLAGRTVATLVRRVGVGPVVIGFPVTKPGLYTFEIRLGGETLRWRTCVSACTA